MSSRHLKPAGAGETFSLNLPAYLSPKREPIVTSALVGHHHSWRWTHSRGHGCQPHRQTFSLVIQMRSHTMWTLVSPSLTEHCVFQNHPHGGRCQSSVPFHGWAIFPFRDAPPSVVSSIRGWKSMLSTIKWFPHGLVRITLSMQLGASFYFQFMTTKCRKPRMDVSYKNLAQGLSFWLLFDDRRFLGL